MGKRKSRQAPRTTRRPSIRETTEIEHDVIQGPGGEEVIDRRTDILTVQDGDGASPAGDAGGGDGGWGGGGWSNGGSDLSAYPILTEEVSLATSPTGFTAGRAGDVGTRASAAIQEVLGWRPSRDGRGFNAALSQCFQLDESEGHVTWRYTPRGYAARADMGAVTGVQASLVMRARTVVGSVVRPLIQSLTPLWAGAVAEDCESMRTLVLGECDEISDELAREGGPRLQYLDDTFEHLLGSVVVAALKRGDPDPLARSLIRGEELRGVGRGGHSYDIAAGHMYQLQERLGLNRSAVLTVADEGVVSNFLTAAQAMGDLYRSYWLVRDDLRPSMAKPVDGQPFLGTQLIWVSRAFAAVADATSELTFALDSVFVDATERQIIEFALSTGTICLGEVLDWLAAVAADQGPRAIQESGLDGLIAMNRTITRLRDVVNEMAGTAAPSRALTTPRVTRAVSKVVEKLNLLANLTGQITRSAAATRDMQATPRSVAATSDQAS